MNRIERSRSERKRLKTLINELTIPEGMGVIVRTAGEGKKPRYFVRDLHLLLTKWTEIQRKMETDRAVFRTEQSVGRKLREVRLALALEDELSKDEILTRYLTTVLGDIRHILL